MDDRWFGSAFQIPKATHENDLEAAVVVLRGGTHIDKDEEERSACAGTYHGMRWFGGCRGGFTWGNTYWQRWRRAECLRRYISRNERSKIGWLLKLYHPVSNRSDFKANSVANRKPMQIRENRCDVAEPRFLCDHPSKSVLDTLKASQIWNGCASQERVAIIKSRANYCCSYGFGSLSSERSPNVPQQMYLKRTLKVPQMYL